MNFAPRVRKKKRPSSKDSSGSGRFFTDVLTADSKNVARSSGFAFFPAFIILKFRPMIRKKRPVLQDSSFFEQFFLRKKWPLLRDSFCFNRFLTGISASGSKKRLNFQDSFSLDRFSPRKLRSLIPQKLTFFKDSSSLKRFFLF